MTGSSIATNNVTTYETSNSQANFNSAHGGSSVLDSESISGNTHSTAELLSNQPTTEETLAGATRSQSSFDPVTNLAESGSVEQARDYMQNNPAQIEDVLNAFAQTRPGLVPDLITASSEIISQLSPESIQGESSIGNRIWGGLRAIGGAVEVVAGGAVVLAPEPFVVTDILGGAAVVHGTDNVQAGLRQAWSGRSTESGTELAAEAIARMLGADESTAELIGDGVDIGLGLGLGSISGIRALGNLARKTGTVWDDISRSAGSTNWPDSVIPRAFELRLGSTRLADKVWVHPNGSKHIYEKTASLMAHLEPRELANLSAQIQLKSLQSAVAKAVDGGLDYSKAVQVGGWELRFGPPREAGGLPALFHALPLE